MTSIAVVSTSINSAPMAYKKWAKEGSLIVAGDASSNVPTLKEYVEQVCQGTFLYVTEFFPGMQYIPTNCAQRKNAALWLAYVGEYDYVICTDDDTHPESGFAARMLERLDKKATFTASSWSNFVNLGEICIPKINQRGNPYGVNTEINRTVSYGEDNAPTVVLGYGMSIHQPHNDAIERTLICPTVHGLTQFIAIDPGTYAAFGNQATMMKREWAPVMASLPYVGRYGDILPSFIFSRLAKAYNVAMYAGDPVVAHFSKPWDVTRNIKNLQDEFLGMRIVFQFCDTLNISHVDQTMPLWMAYSELISAVSYLLPPETVKFANAWVSGWKEYSHG